MLSASSVFAGQAAKLIYRSFMAGKVGQGATREAAQEAVLKQVRADSYQKVMAHEMAHAAQAGSYGEPINLVYNSKGIVTGGSVAVKFPALSAANAETCLKAYQMIRAAANAPGGDMSSADKAVASSASALMGKAQVLIDQKKQNQALIKP